MSDCYMSDRVFQLTYLYAAIHNVLIYNGHALSSFRLWPIGHNLLGQNFGSRVFESTCGCRQGQHWGGQQYENCIYFRNCPMLCVGSL